MARQRRSICGVLLSNFDTARHPAGARTGGDVSRLITQSKACRNAGFFIVAVGRGSIALQKLPRLTFRSRLRGLGTDIFKRTRMTLLRAKRRDDSCPTMDWKWP